MGQQLYHIQGWECREPGMSAAGFSIALYPAWKEEVAKLDFTQKNMDAMIENYGRSWLNNCGWGKKWNPKKSYGDKTPDKPEDLEYLYNLRDIRISWGEWGVEHISVPGNACGLDIDAGIIAPPNGKALTPHNVDTRAQAHLLLAIFLKVANIVEMQQRIREMDEKGCDMNFIRYVRNKWNEKADRYNSWSHLSGDEQLELMATEGQKLLDENERLKKKEK